MNSIKPRTFLHFSLMALCIAALASCVKDDLNKMSDNALINQSFSVPFGSKALSFSPPPVSDTSNISGPYGFFYFDQYKYSNTVAYFTLPPDTLNFNLLAVSHEDWIQSVSFSITIHNSFPTSVVSQIYMCNANMQLIDEIFTPERPMVDSAASYTQVVPMTSSQVASLKNTRYLLYQGLVYTTSASDTLPVRFSSANAVTISVGATIGLQYDLNAL